jgi:hypothetical protein
MFSWMGRGPWMHGGRRWAGEHGRRDWQGWQGWRGGHAGCHWTDAPTREEFIAQLERYQRDLEEETIAVATKLKELRRQAAGSASPSTGAQRPNQRGAAGSPTI